MSIISEAERIKGNIQSAYEMLGDKGAIIPEQQNSANLPAAIQSIPNGSGEAENLLLVPIYAYSYKSANASINHYARNFIKVNTKGKKSIKISGKYYKQRGGCVLQAGILESAGWSSSGVFTTGIRIGAVHTISNNTTASTAEKGEYSNVFDLENEERDAVYIYIDIMWQNTSYGTACISIDEIIVS